MKSDQKRKKNRQYTRSSFIIPAFLFKTYEILENPENFDIISWNEEGNAFVVKKVNEFADQVLPKYFKHSNYASFVRQLNMYDFHKTRQESSENEFKHKLFRKGYKNLLCQIKRKTSETSNCLSLVPTSVRTVSVKNPKDNQFIMEEMLNLRNKQEDLEKVCQILLNQNTQLLNENKLLWNQLIKNKTKNESRLEKIMMWIAHNAITDNDQDELKGDPLNPQIEDSKECFNANNYRPPSPEMKKSFMKLLSEIRNKSVPVGCKKLRRNRTKRLSDSEEEEASFLKKVKLEEEPSYAQRLCLMNEEYNQPEFHQPEFKPQHFVGLGPVNAGASPCPELMPDSAPYVNCEGWLTDAPKPYNQGPVDEYESFL